MSLLKFCQTTNLLKPNLSEKMSRSFIAVGLSQLSWRISRRRWKLAPLLN